MKKIIAIALVALFGFVIGCGGSAPAVETPEAPDAPEVETPDVPEAPEADVPEAPEADVPEAPEGDEGLMGEEGAEEEEVE